MVTKVLELRDERITPLTLAPKDAGLSIGTSRRWRAFRGEHREKEADLLRRILHNRISGGQRDWVLLNAGLLLYAGRQRGIVGRGSVVGPPVHLRMGAAARKLESAESGSGGVLLTHH